MDRKAGRHDTCTAGIVAYNSGRGEGVAGSVIMHDIYGEMEALKSMKATNQMSHMSGTIASVDSQARDLTIKSLVMNKTFKIADDAEIITPTQPHADVKDLKAGDPVEVTYEQHEAVCVAHRVDEASALEHRKTA